MTDFVACYQRGIKLQQCIWSSAITSQNFFFATPQAESKLGNTEGNRNQARYCRDNMSNHRQRRGGPALSVMALFERGEGVEQEMGAMSEPAWQL